MSRQTERKGLEDTIMKLNVDLISQVMVYGGLFLICAYILWVGPITEVLKNDTIFIESFQNIDDSSETIEWPDLIICKSPLSKNYEKYQQLIENSESNISLRNHPFKTSAFLRGVGVSPWADGQKVTVHKDQKSSS